ncbi:DUF1206 domain-containing protein [Adhaeribacter aquaticus]|uniref:DUF1206 domain-containing protein n=1 Tax=Adhaeribacter aquaticus TaxID=299567 RepID=UPI0004214714|nr:DUF1206 domain-containing protein [Adhaeribacter aquaticus]
MDVPAFTSKFPPSHNSKIDTFARVGLTAKGIVYCLIGTLAFMAALEVNGQTAKDSGIKGIFKFIQEQPFGKFLLAVLGVGLLSYTIWRLAMAILDTENKGTDLKGIGRRVGYAFTGLVYGAFAFSAFSLNNGPGGNNSDTNSRQVLAEKLLHQPFGQWLVGIVAAGTILAGLYQIYKAFSGKYLKKIQSMGYNSETKNLLCRAGKVGHIARGAVWLVIGYMLFKAAYNTNSKEAGGTEEAFQFLEKNTHGSIILGALALGFIGYGIFMFVRARYEVINTP